VLALGVLVLLAVIVVGGNAIQRHFDPPSAFPADWSTITFTVSPQPSAQQLDDAADTLLADVAHLDGSGVESALHGSKIEIGVPQDQADALTAVQGRRLRPTVALRLMHGTDVNPNVPELGQECRGTDGPFFCDAPRTGYGLPTDSFLTGADLAGASAAADAQTGTWSVAVSFTAAGRERYAEAIQAQGPYGLTAYAVKLDTDPWALTPLQLPYAPKADGRITNLSEVQAKRIAAVLRLCRTPVEITS
jgi:hypothetical protein